MPIDTQSPFFTWARQDVHSFVESKLDRSFAMYTCLDFLYEVMCKVYSRRQSDHNPLLLPFTKDLIMDPQPFQFQIMWTNHHGFLDLILSISNSKVCGNLMLRIMLKLKLVVWLESLEFLIYQQYIPSDC